MSRILSAEYLKNCNENRRKWRKINSEGEKQWARLWYRNNPEKVRKYQLKRYNISLEDYNKLLDDQDNKCAICQRTFTQDDIICVDHDHKCCPGKNSCGKCIRGLLCKSCNFLLGNSGDNATVLLQASKYIEKYE